jgi:hypothetical protein
MGIWLELGIFGLVLIWGIWQIRDARQAHGRSVAERKAREAAQAQAQDGSSPTETTEARRTDHPNA